MGLSNEVCHQLSRAQDTKWKIQSTHLWASLPGMSFQLVPYIKSFPSCSLRCLGENLKTEGLINRQDSHCMTCLLNYNSITMLRSQASILTRTLRDMSTWLMKQKQDDAKHRFKKVIIDHFRYIIEIYVVIYVISLTV